MFHVDIIDALVTFLADEIFGRLSVICTSSSVTEAMFFCSVGDTVMHKAFLL